MISKNRGEKNRKTTQKHIEKMSVDYYVNFLKKTATPRIQYRKDFFTSGNINGYVVSEERRRIWAALTEVLEEVKKLCSEHNIKLFAIGETVHEAICFHNYAPQSEDLHIAIFREDCARFVSVIQEELSPWFDYRVIYTSENHEDMRAYIITDGYMCNENEYAKRFHGCPHIVGVDISIIDTVEPNEEIDTMRKTLIEGLIKTAQNVGSVPPYTQNELSIVEEWQKVTQIKIDTESNLRRELLKAADQIAGSYRGEGDYVRITADLQEGNDTILPKKFFANSVEVAFGNTTIPIPIGYGDNYEG